MYKYVDIETAVKILTNHTIRFSTAIELNDNDLLMKLYEQNYPGNFLNMLRKSAFNEELKSMLPSANRKERRKIASGDIGKKFNREFNHTVIVRENNQAFLSQIPTIGGAGGGKILALVLPSGG